MTNTEEQICSITPLAPALEGLLRSVDFNEQVITGFRVNGIPDRDLSVFDDNPAHLEGTCRGCSSVDPAKRGIPHKLESAQILKF